MRWIQPMPKMKIFNRTFLLQGQKALNRSSPNSTKSVAVGVTP